MTLLLTVFACTGDPQDTGDGELPPEDTSDYTSDTDWGGIPLDTSPDSGLDQEPEQVLTIEEIGVWDMSPFGGPYSSMTGSLRVMEYVDGERPPDSGGTGLVDTAWRGADSLLCDVRYSLVGAPVDEEVALCSDCDFAFEVEYYVLEGDPADCNDPDVPMDDDVKTYAWSRDRETIFHDFGDTGLWLDWWEGFKAGDSIYFSYTVSYGISLEEEEDE